MSSAYLADFIDNAEYELGEILIPALSRRELDLRGIHLLCDTFRQRGVCGFLLVGDPQPFFRNAMQSAAAYLFYLSYAGQDQLATSRAKPIYDAIGCGLFDVAARMASQSRLDWNRSKEYEDDFLFVLFLLKHFFLGAGQEESRRIIARHEEASEGMDRAHRDVCAAFLEGDAELFDSSLRTLLQERADRVEALVERDAMPEEHWSWLRYFSSEGLALLALADRAGLPTGRDYLHVSERLRHPTGISFESNAWVRLQHGVVAR